MFTTVHKWTSTWWKNTFTDHLLMLCGPFFFVVVTTLSKWVVTISITTRNPPLDVIDINHPIVNLQIILSVRFLVMILWLKQIRSDYALSSPRITSSYYSFNSACELFSAGVISGKCNTTSLKLKNNLNVYNEINLNTRPRCFVYLL